ncbi:hypothetical protein QTV49_000417 [Vibrio vulnificus]|nr:hypothetical protein [Vibrio vulnificus]
MDIFNEALKRVREPVYKDRLLSNNDVEGCVFSFLGTDIDGMLLPHNSNAAQILHRGVEKVIHTKNSSSLINKVSGQDMSISVFGQEFIVRNRGDVSLVYRGISDMLYLGSFNEKFDSFLSATYSGGGLSLVGSPSLLLSSSLLDCIEEKISEPVCRLVKVKGKFNVIEYSRDGSSCVLSICFDSLPEAFSYIKSSPYRFIFIESFSGFTALQEALNLSVQGKVVVYCESGVGSTFSIYNAQNILDRNVFCSMFLSSMFVNTLPCVQGKILPKVIFKNHRSYAKWSVLKSSPTPSEFVLVDPVDGIDSVAVGAILLSEVIEASKSLKKWIADNITPSDLAANLRLDQGWLSISDEASKAAREELVTFDQVQNKITLI